MPDPAVIRPVRLLPGGAWLLLVLLLSGCGAPLQSAKWRAAPPAGVEPAVELDTVPFFPQQRYQCGPAALATVLAASGVEVTAEQLVPQVYVPARRGSLQPELLATARRHGRVPYVLGADMDQVLREVAAGHPVLVLQNLGWSWSPRWHYAVVVGYELAAGQVILRSGVERRHVVSLALFERTWRRGGAWAMVALPPAVVPATAEELSYLRAVTAMEGRGDAAAAYAAAARRWPDSIAAWFGVGNSAYAAADYAAAAAAYRRVLAIDPAYGAALNNLAHALAALGEFAEAESYAEAALAAEPRPLYRETLESIRARRGADR